MRIAALRLFRFALIAALWATLAALGAEGAESHGPHWSYGGTTGPVRWGGLEKDYASCAFGKSQSPINIEDNLVHEAKLPSLEFDYKPSALRIIDNGHTIQVNVEPGSSIRIGDHRYELVQFHFHKPSEEKINGRRSAMVAHLVHRDSGGKLAVVAVLLTPGTANGLVRTLWSNLPREKNKETVVPALRINPSALLPRRKAYYTFAGSLTTPPCSEGVTWFVMHEPVSISAEQVSRFAELYPMNARPLQPLNGREIRASR